MYYSYVMGIGDEIYALSDSGFIIEQFGNMQIQIDKKYAKGKPLL